MTKEADRILIERVRPLLAKRDGFSERRMFGGVCFMMNGNMCVGTWKGSLVVRLERSMHDATLAEPHTKPFDITGRTLRGWALVQPAGIADADDLAAWVDRAAAFAESLPAK